jgi:hypothetical protein
MKRILVWAIAGLLVVGTATLIIANTEQHQGAALIAGDVPVTEDQVRTKLQSDGWSDVQIQRDGRYFQVTAVKSGQASKKMAVDSQTGRLRSNDDDDDDD